MRVSRQLFLTRTVSVRITKFQAGQLATCPHHIAKTSEVPMIMAYTIVLRSLEV